MPTTQYISLLLIIFVNSLDLDEINEFNEDIRLNGLGMLNVNEQAFACSLLEAFDFFII